MSILDNPSLDTGAVANPFIPYGWTNSGLDAGDTETEAVVRHSEGASLQFNAGAVAGEKITQQLVLASGKYFHFGAWSYGDGAGAGFKLNCVNAVLHGNPALATLNTPHTASWSKTLALWRATGANPTVEIEADDGAVAARYIDDLILETLDDVTLTVTPASQANSLEGTGIRIDGRDVCTQPIPADGRITNSSGWIRFYTVLRHSDNIVNSFGSIPPEIMHVRYDANNNFDFYWSGVNQLRLLFTVAGIAYSGIWNTGGGALVAGTLYMVDIIWGASTAKVYINGVERIALSGLLTMPGVPTIIYWGNYITPDYPGDLVIA